MVHENERDDVPVRAVDNRDLRMVKLLLQYEPELSGTISECSYTIRESPSLNLDWKLGLNL